MGEKQNQFPGTAWPQTYGFHLFTYSSILQLQTGAKSYRERPPAKTPMLERFTFLDQLIEYERDVAL
jgi:hypothetical protein